MSHTTVLKNETLAALALKPGAIVFEGTGGEGGLSESIALEIGRGGVLIVADLDSDLLNRIRERLSAVPCKVEYVNDNFRNIRQILVDLAVTALDAIIVDLGLCSWQIEESGRGFSFDEDEPLLMTFASSVTEGDLTALQVVNNWSEENLADIIYGFGGERNSRKIAKAIVAYRPIQSSRQLADVINSVSPRKGKINPATKTFQAIRMATNDEVGALKQLLVDGWESLVPGGKLVTISFHEVEDRLVKRFMAAKSAEGKAELMSKKPVTPSLVEVKSNPRSRSAKLRVAQKII
ncbi:MAG TPA: 16S rRNA (cytosine(1402)-N(4))-methyltransferase RsmH [Candidatus Paceibacterota bacterium]